MELEGDGREGRRSESAPGAGRHWFAFGLFLAASVLVFAPRALLHPETSFVGSGPDPTLMMWSLRWWPHALRHHLNPFRTDLIWAPAGFNLGWATTLPLPALLLAPITQTLGPVLSYNLLAVLAPALSGFCAYLLCEYLTKAFWPALAGGAVFAFSSYEVAHMLSGQLQLTQVFLIPLAVYAALRFLDEDLGAARFVTWITAMLIAQFLISTEIFATATVFGAAALALAAFSFPARRHRIMHMSMLLASSYAVAGLFLSPYLYAVLAGPRPSAPIFQPASYSMDLLHPLVPTPFTFIFGSVFARITSHFSCAEWEGGAYIGIPLLIVVAMCVRQFRARRWMSFILAIIIIVVVSSLGPVLQVAGTRLVMMPWAIAARLPLLEHALPVRFMLYAYLALAAMLAMWAADSQVSTRRKQILVTLVLLSFFPSLQRTISVSKVDTPQFFSGGDYLHHLSPAENILLIPYGATGQSMLWQAQTSMYFRMAGGWIGMTPPEFRAMPILRTLYFGDGPGDFGSQLRTFVVRNQVSRIVVADCALDSVKARFTELGLPSERVGDVTLYDVGALANRFQNSAGPVVAK